MNVLRPALLAATAAALIVFAAFAPIAGTAQTASPSPAASAAVTGATAMVDTKNFAYAPDTIAIHPGGSVTFKNSDSTAHTVTASDKSFDSGNMDQGATWSHVFAKAGSYAYFCAYHTYMRGTIVVK